MIDFACDTKIDHNLVFASVIDEADDDCVKSMFVEKDKLIRKDINKSWFEQLISMFSGNRNSYGLLNGIL